MRYGPFADFNPRLHLKHLPGFSWLIFDNPCECGRCGGKIRLPIGQEVVEAEEASQWAIIAGELPNVTVQKSVKVIIDGQCHSHFNITGGQIVQA